MNYGDMRKKEATAQIVCQGQPCFGSSLEEIVHDFNNILTDILGHTDLALWSIPEGNPARNQLSHVLTASCRAQELVQQILRASRPFEQERKPIELHWLVKEVLELLRPTLPPTITIDSNFDCTFTTILADPRQMHRVLMNLVTNAGRAMKDTGGVLKVELRHVLVTDALARRCPTLQIGPYVCLTVRDTGLGMTDEVKDRIFEPFFTTKPIEKAGGLGLELVDAIIGSHKGVILIESTPGEGTIFDVYLPSHPEVCKSQQLQVESLAA